MTRTPRRAAAGRLPADWWPRVSGLFRTRAALGLNPVAAPVVVYVPLGVLLGPEALDIISADVLAHLDTAVSVGLAVLGVFVGLALAGPRSSTPRMLLAASVEASVTLAAVGATVFFLLSRWNLPLDVSSIKVALMLGVCAAASSVGAVERSLDPSHRLAARVADLDDIAPILVGALLVASFRGPSPGAMAWMGAATCLVGLAIAVAGWLLFEVASGPAERGVFVLGALILIGGGAAYLALSPLLAGLVAGTFWTIAPGHADSIVRNDLRKVEHPLVVLLLLVAGASLKVSPVAIWLAAPFVIFRLAGKLAGGWLASKLAPAVAPADLGASLVSPGVIGVAFALNFLQVAPPTTGTAVVTAVAMGALVSELLALAVVPQSRLP